MGRAGGTEEREHGTGNAGRRCSTALRRQRAARTGRIGIGLLALTIGFGFSASVLADAGGDDSCAGTTAEDLLDCSAKLREELAAKIGSEGADASDVGQLVVRLRALAAALGVTASSKLDAKDKEGKEKLLSEQEMNREVVRMAEGAAVAEAIGKIPKPLTAVLFSPSLERDSFSVRASPQDATKGIIVHDSEGSTAGVLLAAEAPLTYLKLYTTQNGRGGQYLPVGAWFGVQLATSGGQALDNVELAAGISLTLVSKHRLLKILADGEGEASANPARLLVGAVYGAETKLGAGLEAGDEFALGQLPPTRKEYSVKYTMGLGFRF